MATTSLSLVLSLLKPGLKTALIEALYNEIITNVTNYYYFLGKTLEWDNASDSATVPGGDLAYEAQIREEMVSLKKITAADVSFTIPRYDWASGTIFDMYDDYLGRKVTVDCTAPVGSTTLTGSFDPATIGIGWYVSDPFVPSIQFSVDTKVVDVTATTVTLSKPTQAPITQAIFTNVTYSNAESLSDAKFYCVTSDRNVYKCLDNNNNAPSTVRPFSTTHGPIRTEDGYVWKYMYTIPTSFANKFMTLSDVPVIRAITNQYYSRGALASISILDYGQDYSEDDVLVVTGNGTLANNPYRIITPIITNGGSGYTDAPTVTIDNPFEAIVFETNTLYFVGQYVRAGNRVYEVSQPGVTGSTTPTHTSSTPVVNGTASLKFVGITATGTATLTSGSVSNIALSGVIGYINLDQIGFGYNPASPPAVTVTGDGAGATAVANVAANGTLSAITITDRGTGYTTASVSVAAPPSKTVAFNGSSTSVVSVSNDTIAVTDHGLSTGTPITYSNGGGTSIGGLTPATTYYVVVVTNNTIKLSTTYVDAINNTSIVNITSVGTGSSHSLNVVTSTAGASAEIYYGYGYSNQPNITISAPYTQDVVWSSEGLVDFDDIVQADTRFYRVTSAGTGQVLGTDTPLHTSGSVTNGLATLLFLGETATATIFVEKTNARLTPVVQNGQIVNVIVQDPGVGYTVAEITAFGAGNGAIFQPNLSIGDANTRQANTELLAVPGTINAISVMNGGAGYAWANVVIDGDGFNCTATAVIDAGRITRIVVNNPGYGYTKATVTITGNEGSTSAYARAICSPLEGHGRDAIKELYARDLCLSTSIARDRNQGFVVNNDYRQLGILKNPEVYSSTQRFTDLLGSTCWSITGDFIYSDIENDMILTDGNGKRYRVVAKPSTAPTESVVALLLQSIDNSTPVVGDTLTYVANNVTKQAVVTIISYPTVNKYSGEMLFVDNRSSFQPTDEQTISIKTVIRL